LIYNFRYVGFEADLNIGNNPGFFTRAGFQW